MSECSTTGCTDLGTWFAMPPHDSLGFWLCDRHQDAASTGVVDAVLQQREDDMGATVEGTCFVCHERGQFDPDGVPAHADCAAQWEQDNTVFICKCSEQVAHRDTVELVHHVYNSDITTQLRMCRDCAGQTLCDANPQGIHGAIWVRADDEPKFDHFDGARRFPGPVPNDHQYGFCGHCDKPMYWNVAEQRWRDLTAVILAKHWARVGRGKEPQ